ncbi:ImmA/IrrE family metallo-endopeptidase [Pseudarthrobacter oxydans]|uniref:ImmA/IrrE family metallo-endopeptidase n=1 Tax=Pseudarthrobacter oxydans TaxID=1671 RepID=UPI0037FD7DA5
MRLEDCVDSVIGQLSPDVRVRFASAPAATMEADLGLMVRAVESLASRRSEGGACDGVSFLQDGVVLYAPTAASKRQNFTIAHELGHWLVEKTPGVYDWIADQDEPGPVLETICDRVAQRLLIPELVSAATIGTGPLRAQHLISLHDNTHASRPVCAIALAKHLPGLGAVVLIDRYNHSVAHASVNPHPERGWPKVFPWPGQVLGDSHPLLLLPPGKSITRRLSWRTPWGDQADFYVNAIGEDNRVIAVFSDTDIWNAVTFHPTTGREFDTRATLKGFCCGTGFEMTGYPCPSCREPYCPRCKHCKCQRQILREVACTACFLQFQPHLLVNGRCEDCRS